MVNDKRAAPWSATEVIGFGNRVRKSYGVADCDCHCVMSCVATATFVST